MDSQMLARWLLGAVLALPALSYGDVITVSQFGGLNNSVDPVVINPVEAQDLLNVEANKTGTGLRKRDGYTETVTISSQPAATVKSVFAFKSPTGNECILAVDSDGNVTRTANLTTPVHVTTVTPGARLYCQSSEGTAYCFSSSNDSPPIKHNCTTLSLGVEAFYPNGKFNAFTLDRHLVAGATDYPNRVYVSQSGAYSTFATGALSESAWTEDVGTAGDKITGLYYLNGRVVVAKEYGILGLNLEDQDNTEGYGISERVGISNPEAMVIYQGRGYFKGSDNEFYTITGAPGQIEKISHAISSTTAQLLTGKNRSIIITDKPDWDGGTFNLSGDRSALSDSITPGSVQPSTVTVVDTSTTSFALGTFDRTNISSTSVILSSTTRVWEDFPTDGFMRNARMVWSEQVAANSTATITGGALKLRELANGAGAANLLVSTYDHDPTTSTYLRFRSKISVGAGYDVSLYAVWNGITVRIRFASLASPVHRVHIQTGPVTLAYGGVTDVLAWHTYEVFRSTADVYSVYQDSVSVATVSCSGLTQGGTYFYLQLTGENPEFPYLTASDSVWVDDIWTGYASSGSFVSQALDMYFSTPIGGPVNQDFVGGNSTVTYQVRAASSPYGAWGSYVVATATVPAASAQKRYWQYKAHLTTEISSSTPRLSTVTLMAATTGQYVTPCMSIGSGISAWGVLQTGGDFTGGGHSIELSTGATCAGAGGYWTAASTGITIALATAPQLKSRVTFTLKAATETARLDNLIVNWSEGSVAPMTPSAYWDDGLYWSVADVIGGHNNKTIKYDTLRQAWYVFDIPMESISTEFNTFYFGGTSSPKVHQFSNINKALAPHTDNGSAITARWRSKSFGGDPFTENTLDKISIVAKKESAGTVTATWRMNGGDTGSSAYAVNLSTGTNVVRNNYYVPFGARGSFWDLELGNNSIYPFEILGIKFDFTPKPWRVMP